MSNTVIDEVVDERVLDTPIRVRKLAYKKLTEEQCQRFTPSWPPHVYEFGVVCGTECPVRVGLTLADEVINDKFEGDADEAGWGIVASQVGRQLVDAAQFGIYFVGLCPEDKEEDLCKALAAVVDARVPVDVLIETLRDLTKAKDK